MSVALGFGSNLGDRKKNLEVALNKIEGLGNTALVKVSPFYSTRPVGQTGQDWFLNAAALIETGMTPQELMKALLMIEQEMGRERVTKWGPRLIDLDILFFGQKVIEENNLTVPHPYLSQRRFVLLPLNDIAPEWVHPVLKQTPEEMLARLPEEGQEAFRL
ncbi:MAG: 2-amino-4-hydroxy-6-hydroxymethyldihydropteridine diphosphokinase [Deltaproteobacteria bacterium]|nr:2-amino-4-hydroxy-6-hydroxymethyldihydropteridine diphosphokinase [Deltaproteobacteria bacterium]MBW2052277.1 2-amino-4-hydroxy-6-hydroxymethyldihydropteridine diphosphokinase [Deltaproteobacteria bacterium]MBW2140597.1 2-amino-4-hydroxy-6-hydroxymethyldihydropteridine diphosphokinase [Deltaproteobacteria bacterium]MBW2324209.1 2-amino-4-hydroxy-6-hydroxymethyldihydropteridine diphosphokinase [Deltaproteobacteria bacterium]